MELNIRWDQRATDALSSILEWQKENYNLKVAQKFYLQVKKTTKTIAKQPFCGKVANEITDHERGLEYRTLLVSRHFRLIYLIENYTINIVYVLDCRMDNDKLLKK